MLMNQHIELSIVVHAQKKFRYTKHDDAHNIGKYAHGMPSLGIIDSFMGDPLFTTKYKDEPTYLVPQGKFNEFVIDDILEEENISRKYPVFIDMYLVGGEFRGCIIRSFESVKEWRSQTPYPNSTNVILPYDGVFDLEKTSRRVFSFFKEDKPISMVDLMDDEERFLLYLQYCLCEDFEGQAKIDDNEIKFLFGKEPQGIFDVSGKCIVPMEKIKRNGKLGYLKRFTD